MPRAPVEAGMADEPRTLVGQFKYETGGGTHRTWIPGTVRETPPGIGAAYTQDGGKARRKRLLENNG